jgi:hypothetical protein
MTGRLLVLAATAAIALTACIPPRPPPTPGPITEPPTTPSTGPSVPASGSGSTSGVIVDPTLLELLPRDIDGVPLGADAETAAEIANDGSIAPFVSALAIAAAFRPDQSDYVVVTVARVKPGVFSDLFFRGWRDTFDSAVCELAGGVDGNAEADIAGRHTFIGTCAGGVHTYHVHVPGRDAIVSMQGAGPGRFGERVVEGLTE